MGLKIERSMWVLATKDRKAIVKGHTGDRWLAYVDGINHRKKPINMYMTRSLAVHSKNRGVYRNYTPYTKADVEVVKMRFILEEVED